MSIEEKRRAAFEAWAADKFYSGLDSPATTWNEAQGIYEDAAHWMAWCAWCASLYSIEIELPNIETDHPIEIEAQADMRSRCREAIESAGLKVKP